MPRLCSDSDGYIVQVPPKRMRFTLPEIDDLYRRYLARQAAVDRPHRRLTGRAFDMRALRRARCFAGNRQRLRRTLIGYRPEHSSDVRRTCPRRSWPPNSGGDDDHQRPAPEATAYPRPLVGQGESAEERV